MELRQLAYFLAVVENGSFTKAAAQVRVAQPGVSAQIRQLERELGQPLLDRSGRAVRLTEVGAAVLPYARAALAAVDAARHAVDELTGLLRGRVALGMITSCGPLGLPEILAEFHQKHPAVEITLTEGDSNDLVDALRAGTLDAAIIGLPTTPPADLATQIVTDEPVVCAVADDHPLAVRSDLAIPDLRGQPLISLPTGTGIRARLEDACAAAGFAPHIAFEASDPFLLADLAARGLGVAILPASVVAPPPDGVRAVAIVDPPLRGQLALAWRAAKAANGAGPTNPAARTFLTHTRDALPNLTRTH
ncbi:LysR family transcriptional regulator [Cryptosporangium aurantiacum]|uniref:DNA-binding transcriptional regulator, LysR family n=1 Tax=Cryptosporangium aurantiacum TaxID=134849 RepID=A0A1M7R988_9ACTN|nr:LysR family transcriptional regulator [Cryptosporangium aurantiacum]SHN42732.1 DNA-binding transcriptional regulator, LysR family [Cryptosporangium aurantiacum]